MSEVARKGTGLKIALIVVSILFAISLIANLYFYTRQYGIAPDSGLESQIANLQNQVATLQNQKSSLQSEINSLKASKLIMNLDSEDVRPLFATPYLHVYGDVWNVGTNTAYNCKVHVILYQGQVVAEDTYINLPTIEGESWTTVDSKVYYEGEALSAWQKNLEWN